MDGISSKNFLVSLRSQGERVGVQVQHDKLSIAERYVVFLHFLRTVIAHPELPEDKRDILTNFHSMLINPAENAGAQTPEGFHRVITVYSRPDGKYMALEYQASSSGPVRSGWGIIGTYDQIRDQIEKDFGKLVRLPRDITDAKDVLENWT